MWENDRKYFRIFFFYLQRPRLHLETSCDGLLVGELRDVLRQLFVHGPRHGLALGHAEQQSLWKQVQICFLMTIDIILKNLEAKKLLQAHKSALKRAKSGQTRPGI